MSPHEISIIAGGPSAKRIDLAKLPGTIICVNDAAMHAPRVDIIVSMDRNWLENRWHALEHLGLPTYLRLSALHNMLDHMHRAWLWPFECKHNTAQFGNHRCTLNGPNSGHCALNLAFVMRPKRITLVGFDMRHAKDGSAHWYPRHSWGKESGKYPEWEIALQDGIRQCEGAGIEVIRHSA